MLMKRIASLGALLATMVGVSSCAVGPDFVVPAPPDVGRYTKERLATRTSSADTHNGRAEHFFIGRDEPLGRFDLGAQRRLLDGGNHHIADQGQIGSLGLEALKIRGAQDQ